MLSALIMAGGRGTRFWPASTEEKPKQFISLINERTMIQETVNRLLPLVSLDHIFICTGKKYKDICRKQLPQLPERNIIIEPTGRNTAPCILLSTLYIRQIYKDANIIVLPSDHQINNEKEFLNVLTDVDTFLNTKNQAIITIGINPDRPETGYGYINFLNTVETVNNHEVRKVKCFVEKPDLMTAQSYLDDGHYLWNAGMFMFNSDFIINEYEKYASHTYEILSSLPSIGDDNYIDELEDKYMKCESISVDFAIMEKTENLYVIPADFGWDDIGSWKALERYIDSDKNDNLIKGNVKMFDSNHNTVFSSGREVILLDVEDMFVIETDERVIVGKKDSISRVHELRGE